MTRKSSILDLPSELFSQILGSWGSADRFYCLDYELFRAFRDAHPRLGRFALSEVLRLYPQMWDHNSAISVESNLSESAQEIDQLTWKFYLQEAVENPTTRSTWNLIRYDSFHPTDFFNMAVAGCPTKLYIKKIPLFADDVYFALSLDNNLPHFPSMTTTQTALPSLTKMWSRLTEISSNCDITEAVARYILARTHRTLEVAAFNLSAPRFCRTPVGQSFITCISADGLICMNVLHSLKIHTFDTLEYLFDSVSLPSLDKLELVSYPTSGFLRYSQRVNGPHDLPILNTGLNIPWDSIKHLVIGSHEGINVNLDDIVSRCRVRSRTSNSYESKPVLIPD